MDKAEQPTITQADREAAEAVYPAFLASLRGEDGGYGLAEAFARHRTTSLAAQDDWTTKRVAELVAEGYGHWRSCTGCHETNEGAETGDYPFNPVFKTYQGGGCGECGGIGVVWDDIDYADYAEFCLNADDDAPSLAAHNGLVAALQDMTDHYVRLIDSGDAGSWNPRDEPVVQRALAALSAIKEQHHD
jgi:hypothetical protein